MRKITLKPQIIFFTLIILTSLVSYAATSFFDSIFLGVIMFLLITVLIYRTLGLMFPATVAGYTDKDNLLPYDVQSLYDILFFEIVLNSHLLPYPMARGLFVMMGMKLGNNTYPGKSVLSTPYHFISIGDNVILGGGSTVSPHSYESGGKLVIKPIKIGNNVTIGMGSILMSGVVVEDDAIVAAGAVVIKDTHIAQGEVWAGVPARKIRDGVK